MKKVLPIKFEKIWGWELWLYSSLQGKETKYENNEPTTIEGPLVKIIFTNQYLSIQVHPDDEWAQKLENEKNGKSESWFVLETRGKKPQLCLGLKEYNQEKIINAIKSNSFEHLLNYVDVSKMSFYDVPAGLVHGIGPDLTIFEVQQPSDITYRYYDFNRVENGKPRELHIEKALKVQKNISFVKHPKIEGNKEIYDETVWKQIYVKGSYTCNSKSIFINLETYDTYILEAGEKVEASFFCILPL